MIKELQLPEDLAVTNRDNSLEWNRWRRHSRNTRNINDCEICHGTAATPDMKAIFQCPENREKGYCSHTHFTRATSLVWDHDHFAGKFRGWLCSICNARIGVMESVGLSSTPVSPGVDSNDYVSYLKQRGSKLFYDWFFGLYDLAKDERQTVFSDFSERMAERLRQVQAKKAK